jgi:hypothetical protein
MAIHYASVPEDSQRIALSVFEQIANFARDAGAADLMAPGEEDVVLSAPHMVHNVRLDDLVARRPLGEAAVTGWAYLVLAGSRVLASCEVAADADGRPTGIEQVNMGQYVQSTALALEDLPKVAEIAAGSYELHMLKIPALCAVVLWLSELDGDSNLFVPLAPAPNYLEVGRIYREDELLDACEGPARLRLEFDDSRVGPYGAE